VPQQKQQEHSMSQKRIEELGARALEAVNSAQEIVNRADKQGRSLTGEEQVQYDAHMRESYSASNERIHLELAEAQASLATPQTRLTGATNSTRRPQVNAGASTFAGMPVIGASNAAVKWLADYTRTGVAQATNATAMTIGSNPDGGFEVPVQLDHDIQIVAANYSPLLKLCKVVSNATDGYTQNVSTTLPASAWIAEGGTRSATTTPTLAQVAFTRGGVYANVQASQWLLQDSTHDLYGFLVSEIGRQFGAAIGTAISSGTGTNQPKGLITQTLAATADGSRAFGTAEYLATGGATQAPSIDNCITLLSKLHPQYQVGASWVMSPSAAAALMASKASTAGSYLWQPDMSASQPPTLLGLPVYIDPTLPAATTANAYSVWLGNFQRGYTIVRYGMPIFVRDDVTNKGQIILYSEQRVGGNVTDSSALKAIKTAVS
jgi:HK97 family phage major capsid protein